MKHKEATLSQQISSHIQTKYPHVIYRYDIADLKLTMIQAVRNKKLQGKNAKGFPDLFIAEPSKGFHGLYIELKNSKSDVFLKDGVTYKKSKRPIKKGKVIIGYYDHIQEQVKMQEKLRKKGYKVLWGFGLSDTKSKIDEYLTQ